jgi:hypothetical protein
MPAAEVDNTRLFCKVKLAAAAPDPAQGDPPTIRILSHKQQGMLCLLCWTKDRQGAFDLRGRLLTARLGQALHSALQTLLIRIVEG